MAALAVAGSAGAATIKSFSVHNGGPHAVAASADGRSVFAGARDCAYVGTFDIASRGFGLTIPQNAGLGCAADSGVFSMVEGPDRKLYFTLYGAGTIGRVNADGTGVQTTASQGVHPLDITTGPDGKIWFTVNGDGNTGLGGKVGRIDPATFGAETWSVPGGVQGPRGIISGSDGNLYVMGGEAGKVWKVTTAATPVITEIATGLNGPGFGESGPDGKIWFTLFEGKGLRVIDPGGANGRTIALPSEAWDVAFGDDGKAYATLLNANQIAQVLPGSGAVTPITLSTSTGQPVFVARSPNGNLYAAGNGENTLFEIIPDVPPRVTTGPAGAITAGSANIGATVDPRASATSVRVAFGTSPALGGASPATALAAVDGPQGVTLALAGLAPQTTYYYRAEASNAFGTTPGEIKTFVSGPAPPPPPPPPAVCTAKPGTKEIPNDGIDQDCSGADLRAITSPLQVTWAFSRTSTRVVRLRVKKVPAGATIELRCSGKGCPFKRTTKRVKKATATVDLTSSFKKRRLRVKTVVEVRVLAPGQVGKVVRYTIRKSRKPSSVTRCLAPGAKTPRTCS